MNTVGYRNRFYQARQLGLDLITKSFARPLKRQTNRERTNQTNKAQHLRRQRRLIRQIR